MHPKSKIDIFAPAYTIPVENESFDCTLCTAMLEHPDKREEWTWA